ncbi:aldehyde dehydrogenase family protein [Oceaniovalibus guishaninsula JLT2003]|uniref:Aldehyde dehydrogenase family protein n=1 Tax=Oceaniovalibus guishaninsula JLT2003 TaxID=1231392 RepID=K2I5V3_9RHOB|nr:aldehyde dehydrogenase family protein [Oceaniovalibus guishaninsula]EKE44365.1 aldehyde dehydrogenase family protein [Oceaniovalibus guishaninsula JLT2003]
MSVAEIFETMEYGPAPEDARPALDWIASHGGRFGCHIDGRFADPGEAFATRNPATGDALAEVTQAAPADIGAAIAAARRAQKGWEAMGGPGRARILYALARLVQKQSRLFAVLETLDTGKPIRESRDIDIPLVARHFYYHAGMAQLMPEALPDARALGVCGQVIPWNFPLLMLSWKVAPALAMGNTVVLKPAEWTPLTALLFADLAGQAGLPPGVLNIVTGDGAVGEALVAAPVDKIAFTGSTPVGRAIRRATAGTGKALSLELGGKSPYIVFDDADIDSAVEGLVDAIWFNGGQVCCAGSRLLVHEGIADDLHNRLRARMDRLRIGDPLDKCIDMGAIADPVQAGRIAAMVEDAPGEVYRPATPLPERGAWCAPTLITGLHPSDRLMQEEIFGPVLVGTTFRTPDEAASLANNTRYGLAATVWTENVNLALDIAPKLHSGIVWVNGTNMMDAAAGFGGVKESGFGREGGWEGLRGYVRTGDPGQKLQPVAAVPAPDEARADALDRTAKLYIGGRQARPDGGYSRAVWGRDGRLLGHAGLANRKDVRNAVEAARGAAAWSRTTGHARAQILYFIAENLDARAAEFAARLRDMTGAGDNDARAEVAASVDRLFTWAAWADKHDGAVKGVPIRGVALAMNEPLGVIGQFAPDTAPLLGLVAIVAPAIAMGNRAVTVASQPFPLAATDFYQVLDTSDLPGGVVNILTGDHAELAPHLAGHADVDACWSFSSSDISAVIERESAGNLKRTWVNNGHARDWSRADSAAFLAHSTEIKTVWVPYGE